MTDAIENFRAGDEVRIECEGRVIYGAVILASSNGKSLMLAFEAIIDGHIGKMPVLRDDAGTYRSIMTGIQVKVHRWAPPH